MKLSLILAATLLALSFNLKAAEQAASITSDELPIVEFDKKDMAQQPQVLEAKLPQASAQQEESSKKKSKKKKGQFVVGDSTGDMSVGLIASKKSKGKTAEKVDEEDFGRLDREMEVLK